MIEKDDWPIELSKISIPEASKGFAARIIAQAQPRAEKADSWRDIFLRALMPKPALGIVFSLVFGVGLGWQASAFDFVSETSTEQADTTETILDTFYFNSGDIL